MTIELRQWDTAEHLQSDGDMLLYLQACFDEAGDDAAYIARAVGTVARARGMTQLAKDSGLGRESLYKALSGEGNPRMDTMLKVLHALGIKVQLQSARTKPRPVARKIAKPVQKVKRHSLRPHGARHKQESA